MKKENIQTRNRKQNIRRKDKDLGLQFASFFLKSQNSISDQANHYLSSSASSTTSESNTTASHQPAQQLSYPAQQYTTSFNPNSFTQSQSQYLPPMTTQSQYSQQFSNYQPQATNEQTNFQNLAFQSLPSVFNQSYLPASNSSTDLLSVRNVAAVAAAVASAVQRDNGSNSGHVTTSPMSSSLSSSSASPSSHVSASPDSNGSMKKHLSMLHQHNYHHQFMNLSAGSSGVVTGGSENGPAKDFEQISCY